MTVLGDKDSENCDFLICAPLTSPLTIPDNLVSVCSQCGGGVQYRPNAPKRPAKICFYCYALKPGGEGIPESVRDDFIAIAKRGIN